MFKVSWENTKSNRSGNALLDGIDKANAWVAKCIRTKSWGLPDRWLLETDGTHTNTKKVVDKEAIPAHTEKQMTYDTSDPMHPKETGIKDVQVPDQPEISHTEYFFPAEYTYEVTDVTTEYNKSKARETLLKKRQGLRQLCDNILDIMTEHIESGDYNETDETNFDSKMPKVNKMLKAKRVKRLKAAVNQVATDSMFTEELKGRLLKEFDYFGV